jgi:hypothetical protein
MTIFTVVQVRRDRDLEWTVERSPHGGAFDLQGYYLSRGEADTEAKRLTALEKSLTGIRARQRALGPRPIFSTDGSPASA